MTRATLAALRAAYDNGGCDDPGFLAGLADDPRSGAQALLRQALRLSGARDAEELRLARMLLPERQAQQQGFARVAGVDEAGRGPLAGPIVAAAVVLAHPVAGLDDSKKLTPETRESLYTTLMSGRHDIGVAWVEPEELDRIGLQQANYRAMAEAVAGLATPPAFVLVDGFRVPGLPLPQRHLIKGDRRSLSIAAASIIAKVTRDRMMVQLDAAFPVYGFARHKGYSTAEHLAALSAHGPCAIHRRCFAPVADTPETLPLFAVVHEAMNE